MRSKLEDPSPGTRPLYRDRNMQVVCAVSLIAVLGVGSVVPALSGLAGELGIGGAEVGLLLTAFTLPGVILSAVFGVLSDRLGRKRVLVPSLALFAIAGTMCAFTRDFQQLLVLRAVQGIGATSLGTLAVTLIGDLFSGADRAAALGLNGAAISLGATAFPIIGGLIAASDSFFPFALASLALPVALMAVLRLDEPDITPSGRVRDQLGGVLRCALSRGGVGLFLAGALTMVLFYGTHLTYLTFFMGQRFGASPVVIGVVTSVTHVAFALSSAQYGRVNRRFSTVPIIGMSFAVYAVAVMIIPLMRTSWMVILPAALFGLAHGVNIPAQQMGLVGSAPRELRGTFMSINTTVIRGGQAVGPLIVGLFYLAGGFNGAFLGSAALALVVAALAFGIHRRIGGEAA